MAIDPAEMSKGPGAPGDVMSLAALQGQPVDPAQKAAQDQATLKELDEKFAQANISQRDMFRIWRENIAFIEGLQWLR